MGEGIAPEQAAELLKNGTGTLEFRNALQSLKSAGGALLMADRRRLVPLRARTP